MARVVQRRGRRQAVHIRWMISADMPRVLEIERAAAHDPWGRREIADLVRQRNVIGMVIEYRGRVAGYEMYELWKERLQLIRIVVHPECQRLGLATAMIAKLQRKTSGTGPRNMLESLVPERYVDVQYLLRHTGWICYHICCAAGEADDLCHFIWRRGWAWEWNQ